MKINIPKHFLSSTTHALGSIGTQAPGVSSIISPLNNNIPITYQLHHTGEAAVYDTLTSYPTTGEANLSFSVQTGH